MGRGAHSESSVSSVPGEEARREELEEGVGEEGSGISSGVVDEYVVDILGEGLNSGAPLFGRLLNTCMIEDGFESVEWWVKPGIRRDCAAWMYILLG